MKNIDLQNEHFSILRELEESRTVKLNRNMIGACGGKEKAKSCLRDLVKIEWIVRTGYGRFKLTSKGADIISGRVGCRDCGRSFGSINQARSGGTMKCNHKSLSYELSEFL